MSIYIDINFPLLPSFDRLSCSWFSLRSSLRMTLCPFLSPSVWYVLRNDGYSLHISWYLIQNYYRLSVLFIRDTISIPTFTPRSPPHSSSFIHHSLLSFSTIITGLLHHWRALESRVLLLFVPQFSYVRGDANSRYDTFFHVIWALFLPISRCSGLIMWHIGVNFI